MFNKEKALSNFVKVRLTALTIMLHSPADRLHEPVLHEPRQPHQQVQGVQRPHHGRRVHGRVGDAKQNR